MFIQIVLYTHVLAATAWIGGALLLFALGITLKGKEIQDQVYGHIGPIYGYYETVWLIVLWITGLTMFYHFNLWDVIFYASDTTLAYAMTTKLYLVIFLTFTTIVHMYIALKTHKKTRSKIQHMVSRAGSMLIFFLNLFILWFAIMLRAILS